MSDDLDDFEALEEAKEAALQKQRFEAEQHRNDLAWMITHDQGRRILRVWLENTGFLGQSFDPHSDRQTAFNEGSRAMGAMMVRVIGDVSPTAILAILAQSLAVVEDPAMAEKNSHAS